MERVHAFVAAHQIRVMPNSRFARYFEIFDFLNGKQVKKIPDPISIERALIEAAQLMNIVEWLGHLPELPRRIQKLVTGPVHTFWHRGEDAARDSQFELYIAAQLCRGGLSVRLDEPDVVVDVDGLDFGIAAKRPQSLSACKAAVRKGLKQLKGAGKIGFVALDLSLFFFSQGLLLTTIADDYRSLYVAAAQHLVTFVGAQRVAMRELLDLVEKAGSSGLILHLHTTAAIGTQSATAGAFMILSLIPPDHELAPRILRMRAAFEWRGGIAPDPDGHNR